ncbi:MAG: response regulator [Allgaiera sp.]|jgi:two-component system chemotaxis response regulator CheY|nr:response regulator [Allgaiera sp.]
MSLTVLAIDDSRTIREMLNAALSEAGFLVHLAVDGQDGLDKLGETAPDVVITDINMPKLDGFGFIKGARARQDYCAVPILVLTTESAADLKARARDAGATGWIVKPFDEMRLIAAIQRVAGLRAAG